MAQSNSNESNVRCIPSFKQNDTVYPAFPWEDRSDLFQLAVVAKENHNIENFLNPIKKISSTNTTLENPPDSETQKQKATRLDRDLTMKNQLP